MLHPVALFPDLLSYPLLAYMILRLVVVYGVARTMCMRWKKPYKWLAYLQAVVGALVLIGLYTQGALIAVILLLKADYWVDRKAGKTDSKEMIITGIICTIALALIFLGPGSFALDYPL